MIPHLTEQEYKRLWEITLLLRQMIGKCDCPYCQTEIENLLKENSNILKKVVRHL